MLTRGVLDGNCDLLNGILKVALVPLSLESSQLACLFGCRKLGKSLTKCRVQRNLAVHQFNQLDRYRQQAKDTHTQSEARGRSLFQPALGDRGSLSKSPIKEVKDLCSTRGVRKGFLHFCRWLIPIQSRQICEQCSNRPD